MVRYNKLIIMLLCFITAAAYALPPMETVRVRQVGPGVVERTIEAPSEPWVIHVLEVDLDDPHLRVEAVDGGGLRGPSVMAREEETPGTRLVGTVNGDFFSASGQTTNHGVVDGEIVKLETYSSDPKVYWPALGIDAQQKLHIGCHRYEGEVRIAGDSHRLDGINADPGEDALILYNRFYADSADISGGTRILLQPVGEWYVNDTVYALMEGRFEGENRQIPAGKAVLSGKGAAGEYLEARYARGDTVKLLQALLAFEDLSIRGVSYDYLSSNPRIKHLIGGYPTLVREGKNVALRAYACEGGVGSFAADLHPRTAVGFNRDTSTMYLTVVDGRQPHSRGIHLPDLADVMIRLGAWSAMNFDGGGSSVFVAAGEIQNSPSDGHERAVRNCAAVYSTAPRGDLARLQIERDTLKLYRGEERAFRVSGWDAYYHPAEIPDGMEVSVYGDAECGTVSGEKGHYLFTAADNDAAAYVYAEQKGLAADSMYVQKRRIDRIHLTPRTALRASGGSVRFQVRGIREGGTVRMPAEVTGFNVNDSRIGSIGPDGVFRAKSPGKTTVFVQYGELRDSVAVIVSGEIR